MKKHIIVIMNIILIAAILGAAGFAIYRVIENGGDTSSDTVSSSGGDPTGYPEDTIAPDYTDEYPDVDPSVRYKIGIVQHYNNADSNDCYAGFISELNERGLIGNVDIVYIIEEDEERCDAEIQRLISEERCDLLCTIGPYTTKAAASMTTEIPIVFAGFADPEKAGLIESSEKPGGNITGVSSYTPVFEQIDLIPILLPQAKTVAAIYCSTDEYAVTQAILAVNEAEGDGMTAEKYPITKPSEIDSALEDIKDAGTDAIYLPVDEFIYKHMDAIVKFAAKNKIPVFVGNEKMLKKGGFATSTINYTSVGRKAAILSCDILFKQKDPADVSVIYKYDCYNLVNKKIADLLGVRLKADAREQVEMKEY